MRPPDMGDPRQMPAGDHHPKSLAAQPRPSQRRVARGGDTPPRRGPFETERQAADAARHIYRARPASGAWQAAAHKMLEDACAGAGVELGAHDHRILIWLAGWEPSTVAVIAGLIARAGTAP